MLLQLTKLVASSVRTKSRSVVVCRNGAVACWHPPVETPFEHSRPLPTSDNSRSDSVNPRFAKLSSGPSNVELKEIFYTDKNEWFNRSREDRLRAVGAPVSKKN